LNGQPPAAPAGALRIRTGSMRGVGSTPATFANESFIDELAAAAGADPIAFRTRYLDPRNVALLNAVAKRARWQPRPSPRPDAASAAIIARGRGVALAPYGFEGGAAEVFDVEVNRKTGQVRVLRVVVAIDAGLIINPDSVTQMAQGGVIFGMSRALKEERQFDQSRITSVDWATYPIITFSEVPQEIDVVLIDRPDQPSAGIGEPPNVPVAAAIANAIFDATGVRIRRQPFTPQRVLAALKQAGKAL
jgi:nicotinate dehydrogenase subunit B